MEIHAKGTLDLRTVKAMGRASLNAKPFIIIGLYAALTARLAYQVFSPRYIKEPVHYVLFGVAVALLISLIVLFLTASKRAYKSLGNNRDAVTDLVFTDDRVCASTVREGFEGRSDIAYDKLAKVIETDEFFFIFSSIRSAVPVEKATFEGGTPEQLAEKLRAAVGKNYRRR